MTPNDPKLSDCPARRGPCAGEGGEGKAEESTGRDAPGSSLQRMVRRCGELWRKPELTYVIAITALALGLLAIGLAVRREVEFAAWRESTTKPTPQQQQQ